MKAAANHFRGDFFVPVDRPVGNLVRVEAPFAGGPLAVRGEASARPAIRKGRKGLVLRMVKLDADSLGVPLPGARTLDDPNVAAAEFEEPVPTSASEVPAAVARALKNQATLSPRELASPRAPTRNVVRRVVTPATAPTDLEDTVTQFAEQATRASALSADLAKALHTGTATPVAPVRPTPPPGAPVRPTPPPIAPVRPTPPPGAPVRPTSPPAPARAPTPPPPVATTALDDDDLAFEAAFQPFLDPVEPAVSPPASVEPPAVTPVVKAPGPIKPVPIASPISATDKPVVEPAATPIVVDPVAEIERVAKSVSPPAGTPLAAPAEPSAEPSNEPLADTAVEASPAAIESLLDLLDESAIRRPTESPFELLGGRAEPVVEFRTSPPVEASVPLPLEVSRPSKLPMVRPSRFRVVLLALIVVTAAALAVVVVILLRRDDPRAVSPPPKPHAAAIETHLQVAATRIAEGKLVGPGGDTALDHLLAAKHLAPEHPDVLRSLGSLADTFELLGDGALASGDLAEAAAHLQAALAAAPDRRSVADKLRQAETRARALQTDPK